LDRCAPLLPLFPSAGRSLLLPPLSAGRESSPVLPSFFLSLSPADDTDVRPFLFPFHGKREHLNRTESSLASEMVMMPPPPFSFSSMEKQTAFFLLSQTGEAPFFLEGPGETPISPTGNRDAFFFFPSMKEIPFSKKRTGSRLFPPYGAFLTCLSPQEV